MKPDAPNSLSLNNALLNFALFTGGSAFLNSQLGSLATRWTVTSISLSHVMAAGALTATAVSLAEAVTKTDQIELSRDKAILNIAALALTAFSGHLVLGALSKWTGLVITQNAMLVLTAFNGAAKAMALGLAHLLEDDDPVDNKPFIPTTLQDFDKKIDYTELRKALEKDSKTYDGLSKEVLIRLNEKLTKEGLAPLSKDEAFLKEWRASYFKGDAIIPNEHWRALPSSLQQKIAFFFTEEKLEPMPLFPQNEDDLKKMSHVEVELLHKVVAGKFNDHFSDELLTAVQNKWTEIEKAKNTPLPPKEEPKTRFKTTLFVLGLLGVVGGGYAVARTNGNSLACVMPLDCNLPKAPSIMPTFNTTGWQLPWNREASILTTETPKDPPIPTPKEATQPVEDKSLTGKTLKTPA